jgi:hypothetical protein
VCGFAGGWYGTRRFSILSCRTVLNGFSIADDFHPRLALESVDRQSYDGLSKGRGFHV